MQGERGVLMTPSPYDFIDLFGGIGGMRLGFESHRCRCVFASDEDPVPRFIYKDNFGHFPDGDIRLIPTASIPHHHILLAGLPCQPFSIAGKRRGFADPRGDLFEEVVRIAQYHRPMAIVIENVPNILRIYKGAVREHIFSSLRALGYNVFHAVLNAADYGIPQHRKRVFIIASRGDLQINTFAFPEPSNEHVCVRDILEPESAVPPSLAVSSADFRFLYSPVHEPPELIAARRNRPIVVAKRGTGWQGNRCYSVHGVSCTLCAHTGGKSRGIGVYLVDNLMRLLTVLECARLMGYPDTFDFGSATRHQSYRVLGNSVVVTLVRRIADSVIQALDEALADTRRDAYPLVLSSMPANVTTVGLKPRLLDLCSGCGGLSEGFEMAGFDVTAAVDVSEPAAKTYQLNHARTQFFLGDITDQMTKEAIVAFFAGRRCDVVIGGIPCQSFSLSGHRRCHDPRGRLYEDFFEIVGWLGPRVFVIENVLGLLSARTADGDLVIDRLAGKARELGYRTAYRILNAADYGVAQARRRLFVVGTRLNNIPILFPEPTHSAPVTGSTTLATWVTVEQAIGDLAGAPANPEWSHVYSTHIPSLEQRIANTPVGGSAYESYSACWRRLHPDQPAGTVTGNHGGVFIHPSEDRNLTPRELARLQSFRDDYLFCGTKSQVLVQIGDAVPPLLARAVAMEISRMLQASKRGQ